ncbi:MAG TPA: hypothetical protein VNL70_07605, partial [Tepidisphaeraceae bacterium]|nr:hypothetical protein [Tepidisphaeraceae bacterium]
MLIRRLVIAVAVIAVGAVGLAVLPPVRAQAPRKIVIGMVAKSQSNAVFQAAYAGALAAAKELGPRYAAEVSINWQTPPDEDAQRQAQAIEALAGAGVAG